MAGRTWNEREEINYTSSFEFVLLYGLLKTFGLYPKVVFCREENGEDSIGLNFDRLLDGKWIRTVVFRLFKVN
ncbi:hypothetical protein TorRG33x02_124760 [Trema orientale]|uniref:Uncharacterized protein n=1 Tax=Trema orientale TaxID=63057 RepID=A0A2P5F1J6_TREOI|nr:hypothetical protein TorRG33x02_124760 [Trema orientale]